MNGSIVGCLAAASLAIARINGADSQNDLGSERISRPAAALNSLPEDQLIAGLKEALVTGVQHAVTNLGRTNGFLQDATVHIPLPDSLRTAERGFRALRQSGLGDEFEAALNHAAEKAVPEAASVLADAVKKMTVADAKSILLASTNTAATEYFRRSASTNLHQRLLPIVKKATEDAGVTAAYKKLMERLDSSRLSILGSILSNDNSLDLDEYITRKALDGLFLKIGEQEILIRQNPRARTTELLEKVFGALGR